MVFGSQADTPLILPWLEAVHEDLHKLKRGSIILTKKAYVQQWTVMDWDDDVDDYHQIKATEVISFKTDWRPTNLTLIFVLEIFCFAVNFYMENRHWCQNGELIFTNNFMPKSMFTSKKRQNSCLRLWSLTLSLELKMRYIIIMFIVWPDDLVVSDPDFWARGGGFYSHPGQIFVWWVFGLCLGVIYLTKYVFKNIFKYVYQLSGDHSTSSA